MYSCYRVNNKDNIGCTWIDSSWITRWRQTQVSEISWAQPDCGVQKHCGIRPVGSFIKSQ